MKLDTLSVSPTANDTQYRSIQQVHSDYLAGKPVLVRGYGPLSGVTIDCYEAPVLRDMGYSRVEFRLGSQSMEVAL